MIFDYPPFMIELKLVKGFSREIIAIIGALRIVVQDYQSLVTLLPSLRRNGKGIELTRVIWDMDHNMIDT